MIQNRTRRPRKSHARFRLGQPIQHKLFNYRGVVVDVDPSYQGTAEWYDQMARSNPPKDAPWYHVLVDGAEHWGYVAERNLQADLTGEPIDHPDINDIFRDFTNGTYSRRESLN